VSNIWVYRVTAIANMHEGYAAYGVQVSTHLRISALSQRKDFKYLLVVGNANKKSIDTNTESTDTLVSSTFLRIGNFDTW